MKHTGVLKCKIYLQKKLNQEEPELSIRLDNKIDTYVLFLGSNSQKKQFSDFIGQLLVQSNKTLSEPIFYLNGIYDEVNENLIEVKLQNTKWTIEQE